MYLLISYSRLKKTQGSADHCFNSTGVLKNTSLVTWTVYIVLC